MRSRFVCLGMTMGLFLLLPAAAHAGMPSVTLSFTDWGALRLETISFFVLVLLISAAIVRWLWNIVARDFSKLPRLTYKKSLAGVILVGLALSVVLTMIAGSRELLTPGAWEKQGRLYKVAAPKETSADTSSNSKNTAEKELTKERMSAGDRKKQLGLLYSVLSEYAAKHKGDFPEKDALKEIDQALWEVPGTNGMRYLYISGLTTEDSKKILAYEPEFSDGERLVLMADGKIRSLKTEDIRRELQEKKP